MCPRPLGHSANVSSIAFSTILGRIASHFPLFIFIFFIILRFNFGFVDVDVVVVVDVVVDVVDVDRSSFGTRERFLPLLLV